MNILLSKIFLTIKKEFQKKLKKKEFYFNLYFNKYEILQFICKYVSYFI